MMKNQGKYILIIMTAALLAISFLCWKMTPAEEIVVRENCGLSLRIVNQREAFVELDVCRTPEGMYGVFIPAHGCLEEAEFIVDSGFTVTLDGQQLRSGMSCQSLLQDVPYTLEWETNSGSRGSSLLTVYADSTLPALYVDVRSGSMEYIHSYKGAEEPGTMRIVMPDGNVHYQGSLEAVAGRGNATWENKEKKPYNLKLRNQADLLGMGVARNWVLLANAYDDSHIRNQIVYDAAAQLGLNYSPLCRWVELYLNGQYAGLYQLCEKNEIHESRVNISSFTGNLISIEKEDRLWEYDQQFVTAGGTPIRIRKTADAEKLKETIGCLERAILAEDGVDPVSGASWLEMVDLESWVKKYLIEEAFGNLDAGSISQFFYWENDGKIYAGPVWDYDVSMGSDGHWQIQDVNMLHAGRPHLWSYEDTPWYYALSRKTEFQAELERVYGQELRPLMEKLTENGIRKYYEEIASAARRNQIRWGTREAGAEAEQVLSYITQRIGFLDSLWLERCDYYLVQLHMNWLVMGCYAVAPGETVPEQSLPGNWGSVEYIGWHNAETEEPYDFSQPVTENLCLYLKELDNGQEVTQSGGGMSGKIWFIPVTALVALFGALMVVELARVGRNNKKQEITQKAAQGDREAL